MKLIVTLVKDVDDVDQGEAQYLLVKNRLAGFPDVTVNGHISETLPQEITE